VLATGGTAGAAARLVRHLGGDLHGLAFLIELLALNGKSKLGGGNLRGTQRIRPRFPIRIPLRG
jgi:adenine phosphoribosyltransferase